MSSLNFSKQARLLKTREFESLRKNAFSKGNRYFVIRWIPKDKRRLGIVVSKEAAKAAHQRNLIKRIVREYFRLHLEEFPMGDIVVIAKSPLGSLKKESIRRFLCDCLQNS